MRKLLAMMLVAGVTAGVASSWATSMSCCGGMGKNGAADMAQCDKVFSSLNLSAEQKAKITTIQESCKKDKMSNASCSKAMSQIRAVLMPDQQAKFDEAMSAPDSAKPGDVTPAAVKPLDVKPMSVKPSA